VLHEPADNNYESRCVLAEEVDEPDLKVERDERPGGNRQE
jgi:hypothetical protein